LLALAWQAANGAICLPRRLLYVVNRRTVVDQATDVAMKVRNRLRQAQQNNAPAKQVHDALIRLCIDPDDEASPLAISTLRGELADNREWQSDPARPAIIVGTVDMIGSRLLFSGYGVSRRMRAFHAGLLGQDALLVHVEAHLTPAFGKLMRRVVQWQRDRQEPRSLQLLELSATQRGEADVVPFILSADDEREPEVQRRLAAVKTLLFKEAAEEPSVALAAIIEQALAYKGKPSRVVVYVRSPKHAKAIADDLARQVGKNRVRLLTGTIRGHERDELSVDQVFRCFRADPDRNSPIDAQYLVATSAGEVGIDLDADHLVCDLTTLDSMIQRLGRVNRLGRGDAKIHVVELPAKRRRDEDLNLVDERLSATKDALQSLPYKQGGYNASP
jgi:CRISPR-associated endonuclease/helicase Cas3